MAVTKRKAADHSSNGQALRSVRQQVRDELLALKDGATEAVVTAPKFQTVRLRVRGTAPLVLNKFSAKAGLSALLCCSQRVCLCLFFSWPRC
jgi:hypothetical protein